MAHCSLLSFDKATGKVRISYIALVALARILALASYVYHCGLAANAGL